MNNAVQPKIVSGLTDTSTLLAQYNTMKKGMHIILMRMTSIRLIMIRTL